jgi:hypothetical protein
MSSWCVLVTVTVPISMHIFLAWRWPMQLLFVCPELWSVTLYYLFRHSANASIKAVARFVWACSNRLPPLPSPPRLWRLQRLLLLLGLWQILGPLQMCWSNKFGRTVFVNLEAAGTCNLLMQTNRGSQYAGWKATMQQKQQCSKIDRCSYLRRRGIQIPLQEGRWHYGWFLPWMPGVTIDDFIHRCHIGKRVLYMTSSMDTMGHYGCLHPWTPQRKGGKVIWSKTTTWIMEQYFQIVKFLWALWAHANKEK